MAVFQQRWVIYVFAIATACLWQSTAAQMTTLGEATMKLPSSNMVIGYINNTAETAAYFNDPKTVATGFLPTNQGLSAAIKRLGKYMGVIAGNASAVSSLLNYHVIAGKAVTPEQLKDGMQLTTRWRDEKMTVTRNKDNSITLKSILGSEATIMGPPVKIRGIIVYALNDTLGAPSTMPEVVSLWKKAAAAKDGSSAAAEDALALAAASSGSPASPASPAPKSTSAAAGLTSCLSVVMAAVVGLLTVFA